MPENLVDNRPSAHRSLASLLLAILVSAGVAAGETVTDLHAAAEWLTLDTILRSSGSAPGRPEVFRIEIPAPGILTLDVSAPVCDSSQPKLTFLGTSGASSGAAKSGSRVRSFELVSETPQGLVLEIRTQGSYFLAVSAEDPAQSLNDYKLRNTFITDFTTPAGGHWGTTAVPGPSEVFFPYRSGSSGRPWALKDVEQEEDETDPDLFGPGPPSDGDDHGDTPLCATPLQPGSAIGGRIENDYGDDEDYFTFVLEAQETVAMEITGGQSRLGVLFDERHQRLTSCDGRNSSGFRTVRTLGPGRYNVRVESQDGEEGPYLLRVAPLKSPARPPGWSSPAHPALR